MVVDFLKARIEQQLDELRACGFCISVVQDLDGALIIDVFDPDSNATDAVFERMWIDPERRYDALRERMRELADGVA